ncbi:MAG: hypothetical protein QM736_15090 [Vicinamibacterales bacterium]
MLSARSDLRTLVPFSRSRGANLQRVRVILADSEGEIDGRLLALDDTTLRILVSGKSWDLPLSDVRQVDVERKDSLKNGAAIGALILGGWCLAVCGQALPSASQLLPAVVSNAAFGALVGAGIDAARRERTTIYPLRLTTRALQSAPRLAMLYRWYF